MKNALILHGIEGYAGIHWQQWLHNELVVKGYKVFMPNLPDSKRPVRRSWLSTARSVIGEIEFSELVIVGHSLGVVTALDLVEAVSKQIGILVSVSGFGRDYGAELNSYFLKEREINFEKVKSLVGKVHVIYGDNDPYVPQEVLGELAVKLGIQPNIIPGGGHLNSDSGYARFPLLLELLEEV